VMLRETRIPITKIRADGGVCTNNFIMQLTADLLGRKIERPSHFDMSCLGAAFVAGLGTGYWRNQKELKKLLTTDQHFLPRRSKADWDKGGPYRGVLQSWERALQRSMHWYSQLQHNSYS
uniref:Putative glycerol kinase 5 n=1 Tax=Sinocyclocheilus grahami TaxID=75366 RepID=A0A672QXP6_SINGR